jgi:hypothetical protein
MVLKPIYVGSDAAYARQQKFGETPWSRSCRRTLVNGIFPALFTTVPLRAWFASLGGETEH